MVFARCYHVVQSSEHEPAASKEARYPHVHCIWKFVLSAKPGLEAPHLGTSRMHHTDQLNVDEQMQFCNSWWLTATLS